MTAIYAEADRPNRLLDQKIKNTGTHRLARSLLSAVGVDGFMGRLLSTGGCDEVMIDYFRRRGHSLDDRLPTVR